MIYILIVYLLCGLGTALYALAGKPDIEGFDNKRAALIWFFIWPAIWTQMIYLTVSSQMNQKCAWCDMEVAPAHKKFKDKWRRHYLDECEKHPLVEVIYRLEAELKPYRDIQKRMRDNLMTRSEVMAMWGTTPPPDAPGLPSEGPPLPDSAPSAWGGGEVDS